MHKVLGDYKSSLKHYQLALIDTAKCTFSKLQSEYSKKCMDLVLYMNCVAISVRFHIAHLYEVQNKFKVAKEAYEQLLLEKELTSELKATIYRQLGNIRR